jgi:asparagine synthetase B (glutamine-hydrolysing)
MCGIHAVISSTVPRPLSPELEFRLVSRGPDHLGKAEVQLSSPPTFLAFTSTVLALRGDHTTKQPFVDPGSGSVLCWNGEAWRIAGQAVEGNDGEAVFALLTTASASSQERVAAVLDAIRSIEGPFAFVYFDKATRVLFYGRDRMGRRSLTVRRDDNASVILSSIAEMCDTAWKEVEADGIYTITIRDPLSHPTAQDLPLAFKHEWQTSAHADLVSAQDLLAQQGWPSTRLTVPGIWHWHIQHVFAPGSRYPHGFYPRRQGAQSAADRGSAPSRIGHPQATYGWFCR